VTVVGVPSLIDSVEPIYGLVAGNRNPGGAADCLAAGEDARDDLRRQDVDRQELSSSTRW
jgi:hypothetical protein